MKIAGVLAAALLLARTGAAQQYATMSDSERASVDAQARRIPSLGERLERVSEPFLNTKYGFSPLGEGIGFDADPRLRWDEVDCLTFVETSLALALAPSFDRLLPVLDDIRYSTVPPAFNRRNHFVEAQWVPYNVAKGYLRPISREVAGASTVVTHTEMSLARWHSSPNARALPLPDAAVPQGTFALDVVPLEFVETHPDAIPDGTLLLVVRQDFPHDPTRVSHVGFVFERNGQKVLRHASKEPYGRVVDEPLAHFLARNDRYAKRPVTGFALFQVLDPAQRVAGLTE